MTTEGLCKALERMKPETGSLVCLGCGHEHNCSVHGCQVIRAAIYTLRGQNKEIRRLRAEVRKLEGIINAE